MADPRNPDPVLLVVAAFSRHAAALDWARQRLEGTFGPAALVSPDFIFDQTDYYRATMGPGLLKRFHAFRDLVAADALATAKLRSNELELELARGGAFPEPRPLNMDPGILSLGKFMLATTKDQAHRIYLCDGIYAEVTLHYEAGSFEPWPWTYADYRTTFVREFLNEARTYYRKRLIERRTLRPPPAPPAQGGDDQRE